MGLVRNLDEAIRDLKGTKIVYNLGYSIIMLEFWIILGGKPLRVLVRATLIYIKNDDLDCCRYRTLLK
jgi:hypothetical protein